MAETIFTALRTVTQPDGLSRRRVLQWAGAGALLPVLPGCGGSAPAPEPYADAIVWGRGAIAKVLAETQTTAVTIGLLADDQLVWQQAFGWADRDQGLPAAIETRFGIGSVTKVITAVAVMILSDRGLLELDTPVATYLPAFSMLSPDYRKITVRHLICHLSGLPGANMTNAFTSQYVPGYLEATEAVLADSHLKHEPGVLAVYCNDGFTLVERLVQMLTGQSYANFVRSEILQPLEMSHSEFGDRPLAAGSFARAVIDGTPMPQEYGGPLASGGLYSTPGDMLHFAQMLMDGGVYKGRRLLSPAAVEEMGRDQSTGTSINPSPEWRWGLGWDSVAQLGMRAVGVGAWQKNGGTAFYASDFFVLPQARLALQIIGMRGEFDAGAIAEGILLRALLYQRKITTLPPALQPKPPAVAAAPGALAAAVGIYGNFNAPIQLVQVGADTLRIDSWKAGQWQPMHAGLLQYRVDGWWWSDAAPAVQYQWQDLAQGRYLIQRLALGQGHYQVTMPLGQQLLPRLGAMPPDWLARIPSRWEAFNESPYSLSLLLGGPAYCTLGSLPGLDGYILWDDGQGQQLMVPESATRAGMTVQVPMNNGRDLYELAIEIENGEEILRVGGWRYRRVA